MLDNEFDQFFRDRLLDHPSKVRQGLWKQVQTHLLRHKAFLKWYFAGPLAIAVVITGHFILAALQTTSAIRAATATLTSPAPATANSTHTAPLGSASSTQTAAASVSATRAAAFASITRAAAISAPASPAALKLGTPRGRSAGTPMHRSAGTPLHRPAGTSLRHRAGAHTLSEADASNGSTPPDAGTAPETADHLTTANVHPTGSTATHPPIPAQLTAPAKLATLKTRPAVTAKTPNPKNPHQLPLPARAPRGKPPIRLDAFGSPEYFTNKDFGLSYGAGARVTLVFKNHWTITTGLQYLRVAVTGGGKDSLSYLLSGNIRNLHLPVLLGYTTGNGRFTFSANAGLLFSLYAQARGRMTETGIWPSRNGISAYLGLDFSSRVTNRVSLFAEPYFKCWYPPSATFLPARVWSTGLMVGIRYNF